jgi:hypothetical protein
MSHSTASTVPRSNTMMKTEERGKEGREVESSRAQETQAFQMRMATASGSLEGIVFEP